MDRLPDANDLVTLGIDTHADLHVAAALDARGRLLDTMAFPPNQSGFSDLLAWASQFGTIDRIGVEGTGSYGAGLTTKASW
jgi:transposase